MTKRLIKTFPIIARNRLRFTFSDKTKARLDDDDKSDQHLRLIGAVGSFPTDDDITITTWTVNPQKLKKWLLFEAVEDTPTGTEIGYRLLTDSGATELYWDGGAWAVATLPAHYSSADDVRDNLASLTLTGFNLAIKIRLKSDGENTPKLSELKLAYEVDLVPWDDLIYDTIIRELRNSLRATTVIQIAVAETSTSLIDLATTYKLENSGYNFTDVKAVYNLTSDPNAFTNIADSYTPGPLTQDGTFEDGQVNLTTPVSQNDLVRLEMEYEPEIAVYTDQDFYEVKRIPAIVFETITTIRPGARTDQEINDRPGEFIRNLDTGDAIEIQPPRQSTVQFEFALHAHPLDLARFTDAVDEWVATHRTIQTFATDEQLALDPVDEIRTNKTIDLDDVVTATGAFQLRGVPFYVRPAKDVFVVQNFNLVLKHC